MLSDAVTRILSAGLIVIFNAATVIQSVLWIIMYPTVSCPTLSCQLLQKNVSHNLTNLRVYLRLGRLSPCCVEWHYGTVSSDKLWPGFPTQSCKRWRLKTIPQYNSTSHRPFARDGHMVQKTPCWKVNNACGTLKRKDISYLNDVISLFLISCPTASFAIQVFLSVTVSRKGTIGHAK